MELGRVRAGGDLLLSPSLTLSSNGAQTSVLCADMDSLEILQ